LAAADVLVGLLDVVLAIEWDKVLVVLWDVALAIEWDDMLAVLLDVASVASLELKWWLVAPKVQSE